MRALVACGVAGCLAACSHDASRTAASVASPVASVSPRALASPSAPATVHAAQVPSATPRAVATAPLPIVTVAPSAAPSPAAAAAASGPKIYTLTESTAIVHAGGSVSFAASTTPDIDSVTATVAAYTIPFVRTGAGRFSLAFTIPPNVPGVFRGAYSLAVTAHAHGGATVSRSIAITFR